MRMETKDREQKAVSVQCSDYIYKAYRYGRTHLSSSKAGTGSNHNGYGMGKQYSPTMVLLLQVVIIQRCAFPYTPN